MMKCEYSVNKTQYGQNQIYSNQIECIVKVIVHWPKENSIDRKIDESMRIFRILETDFFFNMFHISFVDIFRIEK